MAIRVYRWRKPELTVTPTVGGTLLANTTYYLTGYLGKRQNSYNECDGPFADVVSFTTDTVNKSISVYWKVTVPIQSFADAGSGRIRVTATNHCLTAADTLIIEGGVHAGTYTVTTWENYNQFLITRAFVSDYTTTFRVETPHNRCTDNANGTVWLKLYLDTTTPFNGTAWQGLSSRFSHIYIADGYTTNNIVITAPFNVSYNAAQHPQVYADGYTFPSWCKVKEKGKIYIEITASTETVATLKQALIDADVQDVAYCTSKEFVLFGTLYVYSGSITFTDFIIVCHWGNMDSASFGNLLVYVRCSLNFIQTWYKAYLRSNASYCNIIIQVFYGVALSGSGANNIPTGLNNTYLMSPGLSGEQVILVGYTNMTMTIPGNGVWLHFSNIGKELINCKLYQGAMMLNLSVNVLEYRTVRGLYIESPYGYDIIHMSNYESHYDNVDNNRALNRKTVYAHSSYYGLGVGKVYFHRTGIILVKTSDGVAIQSAQVIITDNVGNVYTYTTDVNGSVSYDVLEQVSTSPALVNNYYTNIFYENFEITVSKTGSQTSKEIHATLNGKTVIDIALLKLPLQITSVDITDCSAPGVSDGSLAITAEGGTSPFEYSLDGSTWQIGNTFTGLSSGSYSVYVRDSALAITEMTNVEIEEPTYAITYVEGNIQGYIQKV